jgi:hypothetical protein
MNEEIEVILKERLVSLIEVLQRQVTEEIRRISVSIDHVSCDPNCVYTTAFTRNISNSDSTVKNGQQKQIKLSMSFNKVNFTATFFKISWFARRGIIQKNTLCLNKVILRKRAINKCTFYINNVKWSTDTSYKFWVQLMHKEKINSTVTDGDLLIVK